ncbi:MAG: prepilin peptidase [Bacteroidetes bacterium]|nr:prepilin peptidase [Bacteroidota bacterium]
MEIIIPFLIFALGASTGSFLSVVIYRLHNKKKGIIFGRSFCPNCKKSLNASDLIPIISYIISGGKCHHCHKEISYHYLVLEAACGLVFLALFFLYPFFNILSGPEASGIFFNWQYLIIFLFNAVYGTFLIGIFISDLKYQTIPDLLLFPFIIAAFIGSLVIGTPTFLSMVISAIIAAVVFGGQILISKGKWLGEGDLYLALAMALMLGWEKMLLAIAISYFIGAFVSIILLLNKKAGMESKIPFGPFLVLGTFFSVFFGSAIIQWYFGLLTI